MLPRQGHLVIGLEVGPKLRSPAQHFAEGGCDVRRDGLFALDNLVYDLFRAVGRGRQLLLGYAANFELLRQSFAGRYRQVGIHAGV